MSTSKSQKLAEKMKALKAEMKELKQAEAEAARKDARKNFTRAARKTGLLSLVAAGAISVDALESEFRAVAERLTNSAPATAGGQEASLVAAGDQPPATGATEDKRSPFWKR